MKSASPHSAPSIIGSDVSIVGNITTAGEVQLDGVVEGDVTCGSVTIGEHGSLTGSVSADTVVIRGKVDGKVRGRSVRLEKDSKVTGDVWHETIAIEAGAYIEGKFLHAKDPVKPKDGARPAKESKPAAESRSDSPTPPVPPTNGRGGDKTIIERV